MANTKGVVGRPFQKGAKKLPNSGRKKGVGNKIDKVQNKMLFDACAALQEIGHDPIKFHAKLLASAWERYLKALTRKNEWGANGCLEQARMANAEIMRYIYPTKKAVEHSGQVGVTFADFMAMAENETVDVTPNNTNQTHALIEDHEEDSDE